MKACFDALNTGIESFELRERDEFERRAHEADVIVVSGMWHNGLIPLATKLRFIQSIGSGTDQFDKAAACGPRHSPGECGRGERARGGGACDGADPGPGAAAAGGARQPGAARLARHDRRPVAARGRADGKTVLIIGLGRIGGRLAQLAKAFDMNVIGFRRDPAAGPRAAELRAHARRTAGVPAAADFVVLTCPLVPETTRRDRCEGARADAAVRRSWSMPRAAACVVEAALIEALQAGRIAGAALD